MAFRTPIASCNREVREYFSTIGSEFCPFLAPSIEREVCWWTEYEAGAADEREEFWLSRALVHTELFRAIRRGLPGPVQVLACENVALADSEAFTPDERSRSISRVHWILKRLYTSKGLMFGKFWIGEVAESRIGKPIPASPMDFISIRSAVKRLDPQFFTLAPELLPEMLSGEDDGKPALPSDLVGGDAVKGLATMLESPLAVSRSELERVVMALVDSRLYAVLTERFAR